MVSSSARVGLRSWVDDYSLPPGSLAVCARHVRWKHIMWVSLAPPTRLKAGEARRPTSYLSVSQEARHRACAWWCLVEGQPLPGPTWRSSLVSKVFLLCQDYFM